MTHRDIRPGDVLTLKRDRARIYDLPTTGHTVTAIVPRRGYSVPWIRCGDLSFKPSDFDRKG